MAKHLAPGGSFAPTAEARKETRRDRSELSVWSLSLNLFELRKYMEITATVTEYETRICKLPVKNLHECVHTQPLLKIHKNLVEGFSAVEPCVPKHW